MATEVATAAHQGSLRIGDTVLFLVSSSRDRNGYIYAEHTSAPFNFMSVYPVKHGSKFKPDFPNVAFATFKVMAPNKYKAKKRLKDLQEKRKKQVSQEAGSASHTAADKYQLAQLSQAEKLAKAEESDNVQEQIRRAGTRVVYGDHIQLQHTASGKYVTVHSQASKTESNNLLVNLSSENSDGCVFKILPRYKVRSEGDEVRYNDQMKLESIKTQGQFLNCSAANHTLGGAGFRTNPHFYELNLSATESALTLIPHYCPSIKHPEKALKAGDCIRLFHREDECYIVAEGSFANPAQPILENVHCRLRRVDQRRHALPSTSANTYWQIEKEDSDESADAILCWEERFRLKHLPTRLYLAVCENEKGEFEVTLKPKSDRDTFFGFYPLIEEGIEVLVESYARIKHLRSQKWLHLEKRVQYTRKNFDPKAKGLAGLQWDSAELYMLSVSDSQGDYDTFTLQEIPFDLLEKFNYVAGIVPVLTSHISYIDEGSGVVLQKQATRVKDTLAELADWMVTHHDRETKNNQKILRNLQVIEQLTEILRISQKFIPSLHHEDICRGCYSVIQKFLEGDSRKNENYLARFIEFFQTQVHKGLNAEEVLVEIVEDNLTIVTRMAETRMVDIIKQFIDTKDERFLYFLSRLCVCSDRAIPSTQDRLLNELVIRYGRDLLFRSEVRERSGVHEVVYFKPGSDRPIPVQSVNPQHDDYELLQAQLHLFGKLCKGNNKNCIDFLVVPRNRTGYISFDEVFHCATSQEIDTGLRLCYVELILVMFVDVDDNRPFLDHLCYSFIYSDLSSAPYSDTGDDDDTALTGVKNVHFVDLREWFLETIKKTTVLHCDEDHIKDNELFAQILNVMGHLVRNGYYDSEEDIDAAITPLIKMLNGKTDVYPDTSDGTEDILAKRAVFEVKIKALEVMELFFKFKFYVRLQKFLHDFKVLEDGGSGERKAVKKNTRINAPPFALRQMRVNVNPNRCREWLQSPVMTSLVRSRLQQLCEGAIKGMFVGSAIPQLESVLLDLSQYDCDELVTASLDLLTQMYFFEEELFNKAQQSQLLISEESIGDYQTVDKLLPELRQLLRVDPDRKDQDRMKEILIELSNLLVLSSDSDEPNRQNQIMLNNFGIVDDILSYILSKGSSGANLLPGSSTVTVQQEVFQKSFCLLRLLATDYKDVQDRIFNRIDDVLSVRIPTPTLADLADMLTEIFIGGLELALKVTESHVEKIFEIIVDCQNAAVQARFMVTLEAMAKIEELDLSVRSTQALIVKNFGRFRDKFCYEILGEGESFERKRLELLTKSSQSHDPQLQLLLNVTDMLAACAEGKHLFIESVCQNIYSIEELLHIIGTPLPPLCKRPFLRFLNSVYMNSDREEENGRSTMGIVTISHGGAMWDYLEHLAKLLEDTASTLSSDESLRHQQSRVKTLSRPVSHVVFPAIRKTIPGVTDEKGALIPGLLEYLIEGIVPFLYSFYLSYFAPEDTNNEQQKDIEYETSIKITTNLLTLRKELWKICSSQKHVVMLRETILLLHAHEKIRQQANMDAQIETVSMVATRQSAFEKRKSRQKSHSSKQDSVQMTLRGQMISEEKKIASSMTDSHLDGALEHPALNKYRDQKKINDTFKVFTRNYELAYRGLNTAKDQINSPISEKYSEEGEELPLGPNFQALVHLYMNTPVEVKKEAEMLLKQLDISISRTEQFSDERKQISQDVLDVRCLQVLRALIHNQIMWIDPELKDRDPTVYRRKSDELIVPVQDSIQSFCGNAVEKVVLLVSHPNESISREAIALMKNMLFSGNEEVQEGLAKISRETREETLYLDLKKKLEIASIRYKEMRDLQILLETKKDTTTASTDAATEPRRERPLKQVNIAIEESEVRYTPNVEESIRPDESLSITAQQQTGGQLVPLPQLLDDYDTCWTNLVLEVIRYMCDGQNRTLQHYLREQPDNFKTVNVVAEVTTLLHTYTADLRQEDLGLIGQILQALIEMCVGNVQNQKVIFDKLVNEPLNRLLGLQLPDTHERCDDQDSDLCTQCKFLEDLVQVKGSAVELIDAMLENTSTQTQEIAEGIGSTIDMESLLDTMRFFYEFQTHPFMILKEMNDDCQRGMFRAYHVLISFSEYNGLKDKDHLKALCSTGKTKEAYNECSKYSRTIEIHFEDEETAKPTLARVHFPHDPDNDLREEVTEVVRWSINRDSMEDKQRSLLDLMPALKSDVKHQEKLRDLKVFTPILILHTFRYRLLMLLTLLLNLFVLFLYEFPADVTGVSRPQVPEWFEPYLLYILGVPHLFLSFWVVIEYFIINWPHFRLPSFCYKIWKAFVKKVFHKDASIPSPTCLDVGIIGVTTLYMLVFLCCSILSLALSGYFYCICLLFVIANNDILQRVLRAVTKNGVSLIWVAILGLIVLFIYAVISFAFLHRYFIITDDASLYCSTLLQCMYTVLRYGLIDNIGLLVPFNATVDGDTPGFSAGLQIPRLIFDLSFFIIVITIGLNIVFGIIVDTFSELRGERSEVESDQKSKCFICDLPSHEFERKAKGFRNHIKHDHNMWDYVYYSLYLDSIDTGDHNAIQKYVYELVQEKEGSFFPQEEATCLAEDEDTTGKLIEDLMNKVEFVVQHFKEKEHAKSVSAKKQQQMNWVKHNLRET